MPDSAIQDWLKRETAREAAHSAAFALGCLLLSATVLAATYAGLCVVGWAGARFLAHALGASSGAAASIPRGVTLFLGAVGLLTLFWLNARLARSHLAAAHRREEGWFGEAAPRRGVPVVGSLLAYPGGSPFWGADLLLSGPRLMSQALAHLRRANRLRRLDLTSAAVVVSILLAYGKRMPLRALAARAGLADPLRTLMGLRDLPGVLLLSQPPPAMALTTEYREALEETAGTVEVQPLSPEVVRGAAAVRSLHELLGLAPGATSATVRQAADQRLESYQSEAVRRLAPEFAAVAEDHCRSVRQAMERLEAEEASAPTPVDPRRVWEERRRRRT